jgi:pilus assembly protein CpaF
VGETGSGKTTFMTYIMKQIPPEKRLITMEENTREYNLHVFDENGFMTNNVVHLITRESEKADENITLSTLLKASLTSDPNYMCVSEMKGDESVQAVASANTGHAVISTTHASSCEDTYDRILFLSKQSLKNDISTEILLRMIVRAFPIVVNIQYFADNVRRIAEICECVGIDDNNRLILNTLFEYNVEKNRKLENGEIEVEGYFKRVKFPSGKIKKLFLRNGATEDIIDKYFEKEKKVKHDKNI